MSGEEEEIPKFWDMPNASYAVHLRCRLLALDWFQKHADNLRICPGHKGHHLPHFHVFPNGGVEQVVPCRMSNCRNAPQPGSDGNYYFLY
ncbi:hypothetical protein TNCV_3369691 [Trichonephila clavipes]|uniref:Uncharacterized protein n=1 Tax=Trichonephila clavipes TaxID=2585209 RepID=A0A8X6R4H7_TRICX|nr:hypothetical protein TNCV_3369691 [Trichonephila clavipes]